ncbi:hypothetical protein AGMMS50249_3080 [candidate division SR1 bacterium]|nr:hypothetical protein AGMMS50249_3080 [candidate division SR1 bacterium]
MKKLISTFLIAIVGLSSLSIVPAVAQWEDPSTVPPIEIGDNKITADNNGSSSLLDMIVKAINWVLGLLSIIALVICLYGGFMMVTAAGDDAKFKKGQGILKQAAIGLAVILLARAIVSIVFWFVNSMGSTGA